MVYIKLDNCIYALELSIMQCSKIKQYIYIYSLQMIVCISLTHSQELNLSNVIAIETAVGCRVVGNAALEH